MSTTPITPYTMSFPGLPVSHLSLTERVRDALARTEQAWEACCTSTPEYVLARSALLDPLAALDAHLDNLILVGAQAIYHHTGDADLNVPLLTTC